MQPTSSRHASLFLVLVFVLTFLVRLCVCGMQLSNMEADPDAYRVISQTLTEHGVYGLVNGEGNAWPTAFRPPLYPVLLSILGVQSTGSEVTIAIFHAFLAALTSIFVFATASRFIAQTATFRTTGQPNVSGQANISGQANAVALIATILFVMDPILLQQSTLVMTETLASCLVMATVWALTRATDNARWTGVAGVTLALAYLCRPTFLVWGVLLVLLVLAGWIAPRRDLKTLKTAKFWPAFTLAGMLAATVLAWTARNIREFGAPIWATTHGGYTLLLANNSMVYDYIRDRSLIGAAITGEAWDAEAFLHAHANRFHGDPTTEAFWKRDWSRDAPATATTQTDLAGDAGPTGNTDLTSSSNRDPNRQPLQGGKLDVGIQLREVRDDQLCGAAAKALIRREPGMFAYSSLVRLMRLWSPLPRPAGGHSDLLRTGVAIYYLVVFVLALLGFLRLRRHWRHPLIGSTVSLVFTLSIVHCVYWSNLRMRGPVMPMLAIMASIGLINRFRWGRFRWGRFRWGRFRWGRFRPGIHRPEYSQGNGDSFPES